MIGPSDDDRHFFAVFDFIVLKEQANRQAGL